MRRRKVRGLLTEINNVHMSFERDQFVAKAGVDASLDFQISHKVRNSCVGFG